jgi:hypothetical protein
MLNEALDSATDQNVADATQQSEAIVDQYAESLQQSNVDPAQQQLLEALDQFVAETASDNESSGGFGSLEGTPVEELASQFGIGSGIEDALAAGADAASSQYEEVVNSSDSDGDSSDSLFDQDTDLASTSQEIVTSALGSGSPSTSSATSTAAGWDNELPEGVVFEDVHLPLEQFIGDLLQYRPTEWASFSNTDPLPNSVPVVVGESGGV